MTKCSRMAAAEGLWRMLHKGPMVAVVIIKGQPGHPSMAPMLWPPPHPSGAWCHLSILMFPASPCTTSQHRPRVSGPGLGPRTMEEAERQQLQFCGQCRHFKAPHTHHCRRCWTLRDEDGSSLSWINTCVGHKNHGHFIRLPGQRCGRLLDGHREPRKYRASNGLNRTWYLYYGTGKEPRSSTLWSLLGACLGWGSPWGLS